jgi:hypothetical protein
MHHRLGVDRIQPDMGVEFTVVVTVVTGLGGLAMPMIMPAIGCLFMFMIMIVPGLCGPVVIMVVRGFSRLFMIVIVLRLSGMRMIVMASSPWLCFSKAPPSRKPSLTRS